MKSWPECSRSYCGVPRERDWSRTYNVVGQRAYSATTSSAHHYTSFDSPESCEVERVHRHSAPAFKESSSLGLFEDEELLTKYHNSLPGSLPSISLSELDNIDHELPPFISNAASSTGNREPFPKLPNQLMHQPNEYPNKTYTNIKNRINKIIEQSDRFAVVQSRVQDLRMTLKCKRDEEGELRASFMKILRIYLVQGKSQSTESLIQKFEQLEAITGASLDLEWQYQQAEEDMEREEYSLIESMKRLSEFLDKGDSSSLDQDFSTLEQNLDPGSEDFAETLSNGSSTPNITIPPSVVDYLSRVGDVRVIQEQLSELDAEWYAILDKQSQREHLGIAMDEESLEFLHTYQGRRRQIQKEMNDVLVDIGHLRAICMKQGVLKDEYTGGVDVLHELSLDLLVRQPEDPLKTSAMDDRTPFFEPQTSAPFSRATFINKWILHQLRHSSMEIGRLKNLPGLQRLWEEGCDEMDISRLALTVWYTDDTGRPPSGSGSYIEEDYYSMDEDEDDPFYNLPENGPNIDTKDQYAFQRSNSLPCLRTTPWDSIEFRSFSIA